MKHTVLLSTQARSRSRMGMSLFLFQFSAATTPWDVT